MSSRPVELFGLAAPETLGGSARRSSQRREIDDALLQHRAVAGERHALGVQAFEPLGDARARVPAGSSRARDRPPRRAEGRGWPAAIAWARSASRMQSAHQLTSARIRWRASRPAGRVSGSFSFSSWPSLTEISLVRKPRRLTPIRSGGVLAAGGARDALPSIQGAIRRIVSRRSSTLGLAWPRPSPATRRRPPYRRRGPPAGCRECPAAGRSPRGPWARTG